MTRSAKNISGESDTEVLIRRLSSGTRPSELFRTDGGVGCRLMDSDSPFAFVAVHFESADQDREFLNSKLLNSTEFQSPAVIDGMWTASLFFGKDWLGRRSLLVQRSIQSCGSESIFLSSVGPDRMADGDSTLHEVPPGTVFQLRFPEFAGEISIRRHEYTVRSPRIDEICNLVNCDASESINVVSTPGSVLTDPVSAGLWSACLQSARWILNLSKPASLDQRSLPMPISVLFSGGLDSSVIVAALLECMTKEQWAQQSRGGIFLRTFIRGSKTGLVPSKSAGRKPSGEMAHDPYCPDLLTSIASFLNLFTLFGLEECTWLKLVVLIDETDLADVKVDAKRRTPESSEMKGEGSSGSLADSGLIGRLKSLMYPNDTLMDLSISYALHMASSSTAQEVACRVLTPKSIVSSCSPDDLELIQRLAEQLESHAASAYNKMTSAQRENAAFNIDAQSFAAAKSVIDRIMSSASTAVDPQSVNTKLLVSGTGADELFGGYARHQNQPGQRALDMERFYKRNLGRDDRVIADNAKDVLHFFLHNSIVQQSEYLTAHQHKEQSSRHSVREIDKKHLRDMARCLGLKSSMYRKRAIQFGTRVAKDMSVVMCGSIRQASGTRNISSIDT